MTYLHTDLELNAREEPTARELTDTIDALLTSVDPAGIIGDEAQWYLGTALEGQDNLELVLPLGWDREVALRVLLTDKSFTVGWGGELGENPLVVSFEAAMPSFGEMTAAVETELSRELRVSGRRRLFGGASEFHLRHEESWTDLLRGGTPSREQDLKRASHEATLRTG
ncbi:MULTISPECIES: hypothetical protein [unclassified Streptomyces]|uniref:hypothetical protein n=1 Tax=unclassified Streptomyces TaxID=2593676 RepID=UPI0006AF22F2|nr:MULTISPECIES: hypothetical protein [unclassified Streptomyces]KOX33411.1 hypothetical protein ADL06_09160 [Streptomyces sp. NRRL F-6491]KOX49171.1 hypothetical protein ADL08_09440 [Streptomyces sp. NRRL F-6492]